jgi:hypothetical protein
MRDGEAMPAAGTRRSALVAGIISVVLILILILAGLVGWSDASFDRDTLLNFTSILLFLFLGNLILWKAEGNRIGWVFTAIGLMISCSGIAAALAERGLVAFHAIGGAFWLSWIAAIGMLVLWFPTGKVPSRRWLWLQWLGFGSVALTFVTYTFTEQVCISGSDTEDCVWTSNPIGIQGMPDPEYGWLSGPMFGLFIVFIGGAVVSLFIRYRKAGVIEKLQLKWFLLAGASFMAALVTEVVLSAMGFDETPLPLDIWISLSIVAIPVAATLAVLRYRLYEIDRIVSRTVTYVVVIVLLAVVYAVGLTALTSLLDTDSPLIVAGSTLAVAALFNPLRRRVQRGVDHRFNRSRYDAERVMDGFSGSLRDEVDPDRVVTGWLSVVNETMHPSSAGIWVRE